MSNVPSPAGIAPPSASTRAAGSTTKPSFIWNTPATAQTASTSTSEDHARALPPLTDETSWPDVATSTGRGRQMATSPGAGQSGSGSGSTKAASPARRASSRKQRWVQIAPSELLAAADAMNSRANGSRTRPVRPAPPPPTPSDDADAFVVRPSRQIHTASTASSISGQTNASNTGTTSPSSSLASLGPFQPSDSRHSTSRNSSSDSEFKQSLVHETNPPPPEPPVAGVLKRVAPARAGPVSGYKDIERVPVASGRVVFGSIQDSPNPTSVATLPQDVERFSQAPAPAPETPDAQGEEEGPSPLLQQDVPPTPTLQDNLNTADPTLASQFGMLSVSTTEVHEISPSNAAWYPPPDAWQLPASAWQQNGMSPPVYMNGSASYEAEQLDHRGLSEVDRSWSGSSWPGPNSAAAHASHYYADGYTTYYHHVPPRHAHTHYHHHQHWDHTVSPTHESWEDRQRERVRDRGAKERGDRDPFEVDYTRAPTDRRREKDQDSSTAGGLAGPGRARRNSTSFYPRRGRSHSQPLDGVASGRGRGSYRGRGYAPRGVSPETGTYYSGGGYRGSGRGSASFSRQSTIPGELPLPVPQTLIKSVSQMDATKYFVLGQIEYYFGVRNLSTDHFLRQQMDARGWIPIPLVASFNRVRSLTQSGALVREVMALSALLEVRGDRVRLRDGLWRPYMLPEAAPSVVVSEDEDEDDQPTLLASAVAEVTEDDTDEVDEDDEDDDIVFVMTT